MRKGGKGRGNLNYSNDILLKVGKAQKSNITIDIIIFLFCALQQLLNQS